MLFRIWQHALMDQPMSPQEMWNWVHVCYGDELGLTSDDEDYIPPSTVEDKLPSTIVPQEFIEESTQGLRKGVENKEVSAELPHNIASTVNAMAGSDISDSSDSDEVSTEGSRRPTVCPSNHEGKSLLNETFPLKIDDLFTLVFTDNTFNRNLMKALKYTDVTVSNWENNAETGQKIRVVRLVAPVNQAVGPKTCNVTDTQLLQSCSKPRQLYVMDVESVNAGPPYCDSFTVVSHICLTRVSASETSMKVHSQIKYIKSVWGLVKNFIEKNVWSGMENYYKHLKQAIMEECNNMHPENGVEAASIERKAYTPVTSSAFQAEVASKSTVSTVSSVMFNNDMALRTILGVLIALLLLNGILYYKLSVLEAFDKDSTLSPVIDTQIIGEERSHEQWVMLLQKQATQHQKEVQQWKKTLNSVVSLLRQAEQSITDLQTNLHSVVSERVMSTLNPSVQSHEDVSSVIKHNEL